MNEAEVLDKLENQLGFSKISLIKIKKFHDYLVEYNFRYNLISKNTVKNIWFRHILDSAQIVDLLYSEKINKIADFGSGAGFPGIIIAFFNEKLRFHVKLYEKSPVKRAFLQKVKEVLEIQNLDICCDVYEKEIIADIIVCRAFKQLGEILKISREIIRKPHKMIILKGKNAQEELNKLSLGSNYSYKLKRSITDDDSKIIILDAKKNEN